MTATATRNDDDRNLRHGEPDVLGPGSGNQVLGSVAYSGTAGGAALTTLPNPTIVRVDTP